MLRTEILCGPAHLEDVRGDWAHLAESSEAATPFQTPEWQRLWWKFYGRGREVRLLKVHEGDDLVGLYPLLRGGGAWRTLRPMGIGPSDYLQPLIQRGHETPVAEAMTAAMLDMPDVDLVDLHQIREGGPMSRFGEAKLVQAECLVLELPPTYDQYLTTLGKSLRYDVRKLDKGADQRVESGNQENWSRLLDSFFELHRRRWKARGQWWGGAFLGPAEEFHRAWAAVAIQRGWLRLSTLAAEGQTIGAIYAMKFGTTTFFYQSGFDPEFKSSSPGTQLVAHTIRTAIDEGQTTFDFMRGAEAYKMRWKPQHRFCNHRLLAPSASLRGKLGLSWNCRAAEFEQRIRRRLEGTG